MEGKKSITWTTIDHITDIIASQADNEIMIDWQTGGFQQLNKIFPVLLQFRPKA